MDKEIKFQFDKDFTPEMFKELDAEIPRNGRWYALDEKVTCPWYLIEQLGKREGKIFLFEEWYSIKNLTITIPWRKLEKFIEFYFHFSDKDDITKIQINNSYFYLNDDNETLDLLCTNNILNTFVKENVKDSPSYNDKWRHLHNFLK